HDHPETNTGRGLNVVAYPTNSIGDRGAQLTWLVMALSGVVLLIACVNLANLQLVRTTRRSHEFGIRLALGCSRSQLIRMLLTESLLLAVAGGALGLLVAKWSNTYIASYFNFELLLNGRVLGFTFAASLLTGAVFGTVPAWIASRADVNASLNQTTRGSTADRSRRWLRQGLVVVELALALVLLVGAGFFVRGIHQMTHREMGWRPENLIVGYIALDHDRYGEHGDVRSMVFGDQLRPALQALPGVEAVALSQNSLVWGSNGQAFRIEGQPAPERGKETYAASENVTPGYLKTYGLHLIQGREFRETDRPGAPRVIIINESMARKFWPGESPLGKRIGDVDPANPAWMEVVGVVNDFTPATDYMPTGDRFVMLHPWAQNSNRFMAISVRYSIDPNTIKESIRKVIGRLQSDVAPSQLDTAQDMMASQLSAFGLVRRLLLQISVLGLLLAGVGVYGVIANLTSERTKEIGIRMALGAESRGIVWLFLRNGIQLAGIGVGLGLLGSFALLRILSRMLPFVPGTDPWMVVAVAAVLTTIAFLACWLPARRATRISPVEALRAE
ncbi:MAG: FtsX-like permease family protein, partial [Lacunisphaera sp.]